MVINRWNAAEAPSLSNQIEQRIYSSRLLGQDRELVLHGGGNTSLKTSLSNLFGKEERILFIKGSGWDLATIEKPGFAEVRLDDLLELEALESLSDTDMMNFLKTRLFRAPAPDPSVETLLHAFLPHKVIDHTHADAVLALTNQPNGETLARKVFGKSFGIVPYVMPGFQLAKLCSQVFREKPEVEGLILLQHGIFTFGETAKESYDRMIAAVQKAEHALHQKRREQVSVSTEAPSLNLDEAGKALVQIRTTFFERNFKAILVTDTSQEILSFVNAANLTRISQVGCMTPDHVIRTKSVPLCLPEIAVWKQDTLQVAFQGFEKRYVEYFQRNCEAKRESKRQLDALPRILLIPNFGMVAAGKTAKDARIALEIYQHTVAVIQKANSIGEYQALPESDLFDVEYWILEQAKLGLSPKPLALTGKIALVTGGAAGIGLAITRELLSQGATVHVLDQDDSRFEALSQELKDFLRSKNEVFFHKTDITQRKEVHQAVQQCLLNSGGLDILVNNAGVFPVSAPIDEMNFEKWQKSLDVNLNGSLHVLTECLAVLKSQGQGGDILFIASKNVAAPGKEAAAYSVAKAAQTQLARVCALEVADFGIRVNVLHPHLIFDTGLWANGTLERRANAYGLSVEDYKKNNLLKTCLSSEDVGKAAFALVSGAFSKTTGAQIPVDGGSDRTL